MSKKLYLLMLLLSPLVVGAQSVRLTPYRAPSALYVDLDRLYNYNRYEHSRFELGLIWVTPSETAAEKSKVFLGQWSINGYAAYGTYDRALKYGGAVQLRLPGRNDVLLVLSGYNDLEAAASRKLEDYQMLTPDYNTGFVASRFVSVKGVRFDVALKPRWDCQLKIGTFFNREQYRFNDQGPLYPRLTPEAMTASFPHAALTARLDWDRGMVLAATAGMMKGVYGMMSKVPYLRLLAQYDAEPGDFGLHVFGQIGIVTAHAPYSRMFDLSGTARSIYFFRNTFLTVRPNTFTANMFTHLCLNYTAPMPLWQTSWSQPQPFLQLNAMWGRLIGQDTEGHLCQEGLPLQSPYMGLFEPATGFDGLLRWGYLDFGFGIAYQICPLSAPYLNEDPLDNFAIGIVATLVFDKQKKNRVNAEQQYYVPESGNEESNNKYRIN